MDDQRQRLLRHILDTNRRLHHRYLQLGGDRGWAEVDLTMSQLKFLFLLVTTGGATMSQLARGLRMTLSTATGVADRLTAQGLARRDSDPSDRRLVWLYPTEAGLALVDRLIQAGQDQFSLIAGRLNVEELALVARTQDLIYNAILEAAEDERVASTDLQ